MTGVLYGIGGFCARRRFVVLAVWLIAAIALVAVSHKMGDNTNDNVSLPGTGSQKATDSLAKPFPDASNGSSPIVIHTKSGKLTDSKYASAINDASTDVGKTANVASVVNPLTSQGASQLSKDQTTGYLSVTTSVNPGSISVAQAQDIIDAASKPLKSAGLEVQTGGQLGQKVSTPSTESSELIGIIAAMVILAFTFGTLVAMVLPIITAIFALASTLAIIRMLGHVVSVPTVAPTLATMIGLGVGIDYALFIVTRHFRGLKDGLALDESIARSVATSGGAVFFAGATVTIALVSLAVAGIPLVTTMGLMAAIAVVVAVLGALTLLPAVLGIVGPHINSLRVRDRHPESHPSEGGLWAKWAHEIASYPWVAGLVALAILVPLMIPVLSLTLGQQDIGAFSTSTTARQAYDLISDNFGQGVNGPLLVAVKLGSPAQAPSGSSSSSSSSSSQSSSSSGSSSSSSQSGSSSGSSSSSQSDPRAQDPRLQTLQKDVKDTAGVAAVTPYQIDNAGTTAFFNAIAKTAPADTATANLVNKLRDTAIPAAEKGTNLHAYVGGQTAAYDDLASKISSKLPLQIGVVIVLAFLLLVLAFRTVVVPAQAAVMNLLSIAASYGVLTAVFQYGWGIGLLGHSDPVPIVSYVPLFMFAILFGLSMDYEVFLVSQIEEHVHAGQDNKTSVVSGLVTSARVITAAATIMVFVFGSFVLNGNPTVQQFGVGLAVAVIIDATVVRCLLVPALMVLMGKINWYMPRWLDRVVPHVSIEGAEFFAARDQSEAVDREPAGVA
ncbi:MAG: MMPL family transporter [Solirubrobacteraceae bacterium]